MKSEGVQRYVERFQLRIAQKLYLTAKKAANCRFFYIILTLNFVFSIYDIYLLLCGLCFFTAPFSLIYLYYLLLRELFIFLPCRSAVKKSLCVRSVRPGFILLQPFRKV